MKVSLKPRERSLLGIALNKYDRLAQGTSANLTTLNLPNLAPETARGNVKQINELLGQTGGDQSMNFAADLVATTLDALRFALTKYVKIENDQTELLIPLQLTEQTVNEVKALQRKFGEQIDAIDDVPPKPSPEGIQSIKRAVKEGE